MIVPAGPAIERVSENGTRRVDEGPNGFMCWKKMPPQFHQYGDTKPYFAQGGYTKDRDIADRWLAGDDIQCELITAWMTTGEFTPSSADAFWPHLAPHREVKV